MLRSALFILSGNALASLLSLVRNLVIARMIPVADYGIAATFAIAMSVVEMISAFGLQQQIIQAKDGDDERFQAALQGFQVLRGLISGTALFLLAGPMADFMNLSEVTWAYRLMALVPVLNAFAHFDIHRLSRHMRFGPMMLTGTTPVTISLFAVWPLAAWIGDYRLMLFSILLQAGLTTVVSHLVADRPYRIVLDRGVMTRSITFGWPLLINNILLFGVFNGDRLIIGREIGVEALAIFSMGMTLTLTPTLVLAKSLQNFFLPQLSVADPQKQRDLGAVTVQLVLFLGLIMVIVIALVGKPGVELLLGNKYQALLPLLTWFAIMQAIRVAKAGPAILALAVGETSNGMYANIVRILVLPAAWSVAASSGNLMAIVLIAIMGEAAGLVVALLLLRNKAGIQIAHVWRSHMTAVAVLLSALLIGWENAGNLASTTASCAWVVCAIALALWAMPELRAYLLVRCRWNVR